MSARHILLTMNAVPPPAPASEISHVDALPVGTRLAEFEILGLLGVGGFGMVYHAFDHSLHRAVAIKEYMPTALAGRAQGQSLWVRSSSDQQTFQSGLESFVGEARLLAQFDHPSLVKVFRFWEANNTAYMVMPLYTGMTFKQARQQMRTPPPEAWLRKLLWSVLGALRVLHDGKTLHRDSSPDNIFLQDNGPPVLLDLGAARHAINDQDHKHTAVLKVNYAPIEQYAEGDQDLRQGPWSDLYSLAAVMHGCLCNDTPLPATLRSIRDRMVSFSRAARTVKKQFGVEYSAPFVAAIAKALSLQPQDRPQSIDEFLQIMEMTSAPEGVQQFDFRADLGDIWVEPADRPGPGPLIPTVDVTSAPALAAEMHAHAQRALAAPPAVEDEPDVGGDTVMLAPDTVQADAGDTVFIDPGDSVASEAMPLEHSGSSPHQRANGTRDPVHSKPHGQERRGRRGGRDSGIDSQRAPSRSAHRARKGRPVGVWVAVAAFAVVASATGWRWAQGDKAPIVADPVIAAQPAAAAAMAEPAPTVEPTASAAVAEVEAAASAAAASMATIPASAATPASAPAPAVAQRKPQRPPKPPAPAPAITVHEEPIPPPPPPPIIVEQKPRPAPRLPSPQEACADAGFLARPMCIHQECQKAANATHPICVENRRRQEVDEQRRRQTLN